ncbi:cytosine deaminase [Roseisalinus antarcticus]|uniref:Cytosine deaminase n=1 Tax=Roseisalinus antarcticus TaxID=254357 RepID=A0A1Y5TPF7_9RHOB|nr:cytosine deaminase [Roseisalinus antarcticus]SLN68409.1 Cytosine deaminase [Roseisalinus antarcticus]
MAIPKIPDGPVRLEGLHVPGCLVGSDQELAKIDLTIVDGKIAGTGAEAAIDMAGAMVFPTFVDMHTHLDKGHIWPRSPNATGTFDGAINAVRADSTSRWAAEDVRARMTFALRCAHAHGTGAIRTHLDSHPPQDEISWAVFDEVRADWADRIALQAASLVSCDYVLEDSFPNTAAIVASKGGVLGMVTYPSGNLTAQIDRFFAVAMDKGLEVDFHVDETLDPGVNTLRDLAQKVIDTGYDRPVTVGHLCSLSVMPEAEALETLDLVARAGLNVVSLPMCNLYLQDRHPNRTPRKRGITIVHEMVARGIPVSFASDNTRDPFYAYGDLDMIEVMREATRIGHLDHSDYPWTRAFLANPAAACGFEAPSLAPGAPADLVICNARNFNELLARPQSDRVVLRKGVRIDTTLPDYAELDPLMRTA